MEVDLDALAHNYREIRRLVGPETQIIAPVKSNGYGAGIVKSARMLERLMESTFGLYLLCRPVSPYSIGTTLAPS
jgi:alanine racemase